MTDETTPIVETDPLEAANATALAATEDPIAMAALNATLRSSIKGAHAVIFALVARMQPDGGTIVLTRAEWQAPDPQLELKIKSNRDTVELAVKRKINLAIRPKGKR